MAPIAWHLCTTTKAYLYEHAERLQHLDGDFTSSVRWLLEYVGEVLEDVVLKEVLKEFGVVLITPDHKLGNTAQRLHHSVSVCIVDSGVATQDVPEMPQMFDREAVNVLLLRSSKKTAQPGRSSSGHYPTLENKLVFTF